MKTIVLILGLFLLNPVEAKQKYYKWKDADGNIHYSESKPINNAASEMKVRTSQPSITPAINEDKTDSGQATIENTEKSENEKAFDAYNEKEKVRVEELNNKESCKTAKQNLATLQKTQRVRTLDKITGEYTRMDDTQRLNALKAAKKLIKDVCQ
jgi:hypothetical protein